MKREPDLIRQILLQIEQHPGLTGPVKLDLADYTPDQISYHVMLLDEAGLIEASNDTNFGGIEWSPDRLTWHGHEFLDAARNDQSWGQVKQALGKTGGFVVAVAEQLLLELVKAQALKFLP